MITPGIPQRKSLFSFCIKSISTCPRPRVPGNALLRALCITPTTGVRLGDVPQLCRGLLESLELVLRAAWVQAPSAAAIG